MKVAVINEISARDKNPDIISALKGVGIEALNAGMLPGEYETELTYIHTGLMAATLLNLQTVDMVIGGCGTGEGFLISAMQYPNVFCGLIGEPLDAWLFSQINGGNCISLALNKGYGWAGNINLEYIMEKLFKDESGRGYPPARSISQAESRMRLKEISETAHKGMKDILNELERDITERIFSYRPFTDIIYEAPESELKSFIIKEFLEG